MKWQVLIFFNPTPHKPKSSLHLQRGTTEVLSANSPRCDIVECWSFSQKDGTAKWNVSDRGKERVYF